MHVLTVSLLLHLRYRRHSTDETRAHGLSNFALVLVAAFVHFDEGSMIHRCSWKQVVSMDVGKNLRRLPERILIWLQVMVAQAEIVPSPYT